MTSEALPTTREELERKTVEILDELSHRLHASRLTRSDFGFAAHMLWKVTAGLVDSSVSDLCQAAADMAGHDHMRQVFAGPNNVIVFSWHAHDDNFLMEVFAYGKGTKLATSRQVACSIEDRHDRLATTFAALVAKGYFKA